MKVVTHGSCENEIDKCMGSKAKLHRPLHKYVYSKESMQE